VCGEIAEREREGHQPRPTFLAGDLYEAAEAEDELAKLINVPNIPIPHGALVVGSGIGDADGRRTEAGVDMAEPAS
jgi:hypothetical protein